MPSIQNEERCAALAKALNLADQLRDCLRPLAAGNEDAEITTEALGLIYNFIAEAREGAERGVS